jgi:sulfane dehydrogenase subunit SoxC
MPDGKARHFSFVMEASSVITSPSGGQRLSGAGAYQISGLAWSGRGKIQAVEVSTDGGTSWQQAELQTPILSKAFTRFQLSWHWNGAAATIQSRSIDETGYIQPTREAIVAVRGLRAGPDGFNHFNGIKPWQVLASGEVTHA